MENMPVCTRKKFPTHSCKNPCEIDKVEEQSFVIRGQHLQTLGYNTCRLWNVKLKSVLFYFPDVEDDSFEVGREFWLADEECVVEPGVFAVGRGFEYWSCLEVRGGSS